jgi:hypothetical protein
MSTAKIKPMYHELVILAASPAMETWLSDDAGYLVPKEVGELRPSLLPGPSVVACGLGTPTYPRHLAKASRYTQSEGEAGPSCARPMPQLPLA